MLLCRALADCLYEIRAVFQEKKKAGNVTEPWIASKCNMQKHTAAHTQTHSRVHTHMLTPLMTQTHNIKPNAATKICMVLSNALVNITWQSVHTGLIGF